MDRIFTLGARETRVRSYDADAVQIPEIGPRVWVCDSNTRSFVPAGETLVVELPAGEEGKNWDSVIRIIDTLLAVPFGRDGVVVALGGGVVCDVAAFAASIYMRGCRLVLIPSTLLSMVDASLGGKTGIDYGTYKNMIGSFYPASEIAIYPFLLKTISEKEYMSGLAEVLKHGFLESGSLFDDLRSKRCKVLERDVAVLNDLIPRSLAVKGSIVEEDPTEQGIRAHLNLGHTFGHALESVLGLGAVPHGHGVAWGIARAIEAGLALGETDPSWAEESLTFLNEYGYDLQIKIPDAEAYFAALKKDKKLKSGKVRFVLQRRRGETFLSPLEDSLLEKVLRPFT